MVELLMTIQGQKPAAASKVHLPYGIRLKNPAEIQSLTDI
jgi:hypothetical protein